MPLARRASRLLAPILVLAYGLACVLAALAPAAPARAADVPLAAMLGQMLLVGFRGAEPAECGQILADIKAGRVGGVILFDYDVALKKAGRNILSQAQTQRLITALKARARIPLLVAVDQEGGKVNRLKPKLGFPESPSAAALGALNNPSATEASATRLGAWMRALGFNLNFAPVADVNVNPNNPAIGKLDRSFSGDPAVVAVQAEAFARGLRAAGLLAGIKHFPGHGSSAKDSHLGLVDVTQTWSAAELTPFARIIRGHGCDVVMTAHIFNTALDPKYPATLSKRILTGILRERLGYQGVIAADDLQMKAIATHYGFEQALFLAVDAGVDLLVIGNNLAYEPDVAIRAVAALERMVKEGKISRARIEQSYRRIMGMKERVR